MRAAYLGPSFTLGRHRNAVAVLAVGLEAPFLFGARDDRRDATEHRQVLIPPGHWHWLDARGGRMAFLYLDADDVQRPALEGRRDIDTDRLVDAFAGLSCTASALETGWATLMATLRLPAPGTKTAAIGAAMAAVRDAPAKRHAVASHAARATCAVSTFQRRFRAEVGLPWRRWRQWQRLGHAARAICHGSDLTTAAMEAGFASGSHFSDVFRETFGLPPSRLVAWQVAWRAVDR